MTETELTRILRQMRDKDMTVDDARHYIQVHTEEVVVRGKQNAKPFVEDVQWIKDLNGAECHSA